MDERFVISGSADATLKLWNVAGGGELFTFRGHSTKQMSSQSNDGGRKTWLDGWVQSVALSFDGRFVISGGGDSRAILWSVSNGTRVHTFEHDGPLSRAVFSNDGRMLITVSSPQTITHWDVDSGRQIKVLHGQGRPFPAELSRDGRVAAVRGWGGANEPISNDLIKILDISI